MKKVKRPNVEQLPSGSYRVRVMISGKKHSIVESSVKEVLEKYYQLIAGEQIAEHTEKVPTSMTLGECIDRFIESRMVSCSPATIRGYQVARRNAFPVIMDRTVNSITDADFQKAINSASRNHSGKTVKNQWAIVSSAMDEICGRKVKVQLPPVVRNEHEYLTAEQIPIFVDEIKKEKPEFQIAALLGLHSLRRSEICDVTWKDIDFRNRTIHVRGSAVYDGDCILVHKKTNKTSKSRRDIPIFIDDLYDVLLQCRKNDGYVVTLAPGTIQRTVNRVCARAGLPQVGCHGLRHSFASLAFSPEINLPLPVVQELGGWEDESTVKKIYTHTCRHDIDVAASTLHHFFGRP